MPQSPSNLTVGTAIRFDAATTAKPQAVARQSTRVLICVPYLRPRSSSPAEVAVSDTTAAERPGSTSFAQRSSSFDLAAAHASRGSEILQLPGPAQQLRIDAAHREAPPPHSVALTWLEKRTDLLGGLLERKSLLAIGLIVAAVATAALLLTSRSHPFSHDAKHQSDAQARVTAPGSSAPNIIRAEGAHLRPAPPPTELEQSVIPSQDWNIPAAANLPASLSASASQAAIPRPISLARREPSPAPTSTDLRPAGGRSGAAAFAGGIERPLPPTSK